jgi:lipid A 4'-phosphatase
MNIAMNNLLGSLVRKDVILCCLCAVIFYNFSAIDLWFSGQFYKGGEFYLDRHPLVYGTYWLFARVHLLVVGILLMCTLRSLGMAVNRAKVWRKQCSFLLLVLVLGPGLMVSSMLKNHSIGRARPVQIEQFGGQDHFTPAFVYSGQCRTNCSFVSGHAAFAFSFMALFFVFGRKRFMLAGILLGALVGLGRIAQGGHFLSDVVFSFWVTYFCMLLVAKAFAYQSHWLGLVTTNNSWGQQGKLKF